MSCQSRMAEWTAVIRTHLPMLSHPPWLILTDLPPEASEAGWYGLRA
jgi:hypothetical protein